MNAILLAVCLSAGLPSAQPRVVFQDRFEGKLAKGWTWLREDPKAYRFQERALEIRVEPGQAQTAKNVLLFPAPDRMARPYAIRVAVTFLTPPTNQFEQAGITWYHDGRPAFKLVHEWVDGKTVIIPGRVETTDSTVDFSLIVNSEGYMAKFRASGDDEFRVVGEGKLPAPGRDQVSIQCYNGPADAEHWVRFENFRILELR